MSVLALRLRTLAGRSWIKRALREASREDQLIARCCSDAQRGPKGGAISLHAVRDQLGLKLESSKAERDMLIIDRFEPPTEN